MEFDAQKEHVLASLGQPDRSKKGGVDEEAWPLLDAINHHPDLYTTSSCAGRIDLFVEPPSGKKHEGAWLFVTHQPADRAAVERALAQRFSGTLWFRMEGAILHVACRDVATADAFLKLCKAAGWKHSGLTGTSPKVMIEAATSERLDVPIGKEGALFVPDSFIAFLVREANKKLARTREKMERLEQLVASWRLEGAR